MGAYPLLLLVASLILTAAPAQAETLVCAEEQITFAPARPGWPHISGDLAVWRDFRNGAPDLWSYDFALGVEAEVPVSRGVSQDYLEIDDGFIVWTDGDHTYTYDTATGDETQVTNDLTHDRNPAVSGRNIVWQAYELGYSDVYLFDIVTGQRHLVSVIDHDPTLGLNGSEPSIEGRYIVWHAQSDPNPAAFPSLDVRGYDMGPDETFGTADDLGEWIVAGGLGNQMNPTVYGEYVTWMSDRFAQQWEVWIEHLPTGVETRLTLKAGDQRDPAIWGDWVIWFDDLDNTIELYDITRQEYGTVGPANIYLSNADLFGDRVVWLDVRDGEDNLFAATCAWQAPPPVCGIGPELALLVPLLAAARKRSLASRLGR
jgi:beta propeller repeat protein